MSASSLLGYRQSFAYNRVTTGGGNGDFPPTDPNLQPRVIYHQKPDSTDELGLELQPWSDALESVFPVVGETANFVVHTPEYVLDGAVAAGRKIGEVIITVGERVVSGVAAGVNTVVNAAEGGVANAAHQMEDLFSNAEMRLNLVTGLPPIFGGAHIKRLDSVPVGSNTPAYLWLPVAVPADAVVMAFDFTLTGDGKSDGLAFGINGTNLFTLETKFVPVGQLSPSALIDVTAFAGATNEFFFGLTGGTSTNCTAQIQNIKFFTLAPPKLRVASTNGATAVSWPSTLAGFVLESAASLGATNWTLVSDSPGLFGGAFTLTNAVPEGAKFFRLRK